MYCVERLLDARDQSRDGGASQDDPRGRWRRGPPRYQRPPAASKLDPFQGVDLRAAAGGPDASSRCGCVRWPRELGYEGGKTIFDDYVREVRPRFLVKRTFQRTIYRPGELVQCDLWEPREPVPVGHGQTRRGWVVTAELCWSRVIAGALIFSKEAPDILWGLGRCLCADRGAAGEAGLGSRGRDPPAAAARRDAFAGVLRAARRRLGDPRCRRRAGQGRCSSARIASCAPTSSPAGGSRTRWTSSCSSTAGAIGSTSGCIARSAPSPPSDSSRSASGCGRCRPGAAGLRPPAGRARSAAAVSARRSQRLLDRPGVRRAPRRGARLADAR